MTRLGQKFELQIPVFDPSNTAGQKTIELDFSFGFFDFRHLMSHRGKGYYIPEKFLPCNGWGSQLSFKPFEST